MRRPRSDGASMSVTEYRAGINESQAYVRVVKSRRNDPERDDEADEDVDLSPPRHDEGGPDVGDLRPIKSEERHACERSTKSAMWVPLLECVTYRDQC